MMTAGPDWEQKTQVSVCLARGKLNVRWRLTDNEGEWDKPLSRRTEVMRSRTDERWLDSQRISLDDDYSSEGE